MKKIAITLFALLSMLMVNGQVINVCGSDTIVLQVTNYQNGIVEWQESIDTLNWVTIPETVGETYRFFPTQEKYYRAIVKTSFCDPIYSATSFVQLPPIANAGSDRVAGGNNITLLGNKLSRASGEWSIISGNGGVVLEPGNPYSQFTGIYNQVYNLLWTVTNSCGQSWDTIKIQFQEIKAKYNFIVVDNTDSIVSDTTEMAMGTYKIKFSDPTITPFDSVILIGMRDSLNFLRKVISFTLQDSIYSFTTEQGSFEDLFTSGTINIGDAINQGILKGNTALQKGQNIGMNDYPTRQTLKDYSNNKGVFLLYSGDNSGGKRKKGDNNTNDDKEINIPIASKNIFELYDGALQVTLDDYLLQLTPNFVSQFSILPFNFKFGLDNAILKYNYTLTFNATKAVNLIEKEKALIHAYKKLFVIMAGGVPIPATLNIGLYGSCNIGIEAGLTVIKKDNYSNNITAIIEAKKVGFPDFTFASNESSTASIETKSTLNAGITAGLEIGPEISFKIFDVLGPYIKTPLKINLDFKINTDKNWSGESSMGLSGEIGAKAVIDKTIFFDKFTLFDFKYSIWGDALTLKFKWPNKLELTSGDLQKGQSGLVLPKPISFKVTNSFGTGVPYVPVRFELENGNGSIQNNVIYADILGQVNLNWTFGSNTVCKLKAFVLDYENTDIENSPIFVTAYSSGVASSCENSNLAISLKSAQTYKYPSVTGGSAPYTYSTNGSEYSNQVPHFDNSIYGNFKIYVKDKNQCTIVKAFTITASDPCKNSDLTMDIYTLNKTIQITGNKGTAPYLYSIDNQTDYTANNSFSNLSSGVHTVYVKDSKLCTVSSDVNIYSQTTPAIKASYPLNGASLVPTTNVTFNWLVGNYTSNQVYDLYLRVGSESFSLMASNLNATSYTYNTELAYSSNYTWKIIVKGSNGAVLDFNEFTFYTLSGLDSTPTTPVLLQPTNGATSVGLPVILKWTGQPGDFKYDLYLDTINASKLVALNLDKTEFTINNLMAGKTYYWKIKIKSMVSGKTNQSVVCHFVLAQNALIPISDIDGNVYKTVTIGTQTWIVENLKTTKYNDGTAIPNVTDGTAWAALTTPSYCWYNNDATTYKATYGALYNWYTVNSTSNGGKNVCPTSWHVPTDAEWTTLTTYLGGESVAGGKLKETGTTHWTTPNTGATNEGGFTALPGGYRYYDGVYDFIGTNGGWWSSTEYSATHAWSRYMACNYYDVYRGYSSKQNGFSVRCLRDL